MTSPIESLGDFASEPLEPGEHGLQKLRLAEESMKQNATHSTYSVQRDSFEDCHEGQ
jgi:hypothetical protein